MSPWKAVPVILCVLPIYMGACLAHAIHYELSSRKGDRK